MTDGDLARARRTLGRMSTDVDQRMVEEFAAGTDVPTIAARYAVPEAYVDRVIEDAQGSKPSRWQIWSLNSWGNRLLYSFLAGLVVQMATGISALSRTVVVVVFVLITAIVIVGRRR